jgi:hypothetical protein
MSRSKSKNNAHVCQNCCSGRDDDDGESSKNIEPVSSAVYFVLYCWSQVVDIVMQYPFIFNYGCGRYNGIAGYRFNNKRILLIAADIAIYCSIVVMVLQHIV